VNKDDENPPPPGSPPVDEDEKEPAKAATNEEVPSGPTKKPSFNSPESVAKSLKNMRMPPKMNLVQTPKEIAIRYPDSMTRSYDFYRLDERKYQFYNSTPHNPNKYYFSIAAMFKNEAGAMKEWLDHHIAHGVDHFYLVNDARPGEDDGVDAILAPYIEKGIVSMVIFT
jgi:hypothetical protein